MQKLISLGLVSLVAIASLIPLAQADSDNRRIRTHSGTAITETQLTCVRTAVSSREASVRAAYSTLSTSYLAGLDTRAKALESAWALTDKTARKTAREAAWSAWNITAKNARDTFRTARKAAWDTYRTSVKACKVSSNEVESSMVQNQDVQ